MYDECIIGLLYDYDNTRCVTLQDLIEYCDRQAELNKYGRELGLPPWPEHTLKDYADKRKSTNLRRFMYCPDCGAVIDWAVIRRGGS